MEPADVIRIDCPSWLHHYVDGVEQIAGKPHVYGLQLTGEMFQRARSEDRGRHRAMLEHEPKPELDQRQARFDGNPFELLDGVELPAAIAALLRSK